MTGLEKIIKEIEKDSEDRVNRIIAEANDKADEIIKAAEKEAKEKAEAIAENAAVSERDIIERAKSADELNIKKQILLKKQEIISDIIHEAESRLDGLADKEYFDIILSMAKKFSSDKNGEIIFSKQDKKRMPSDFEEKLKAECSFLKISDKDADIGGGFILSYGGIEENCTFKALFESNIEMLQDKVHTLLFE
ncbi:MAG: V-type ATP synthase subunit E [Oscillospiraceae bacterium]|nr:V-type ATP synthase subunit E [Oscillospiraceae bacterium]